MQKVTIKSYAISHKLSIFNVMKMVKSGKLKSEVIEENGKEITYIIIDEGIETEVKEGIVSAENTAKKNLDEEIKLLSNEVGLLRMEIEALKKRLDIK